VSGTPRDYHALGSSVLGTPKDNAWAPSWEGNQSIQDQCNRDASGAIGTPENHEMSASTSENFGVTLDSRHSRNSGREALSNISNMIN